MVLWFLKVSKEFLRVLRFRFFKVYGFEGLGGS